MARGGSFRVSVQPPSAALQLALRSACQGMVNTSQEGVAAPKSVEEEFSILG